jgi:hypothetical protein
MAEPRLAAPESVAGFPDFRLILPIFAGLVIVVAAVEDIFLKDLYLKYLKTI